MTFIAPWLVAVFSLLLTLSPASAENSLIMPAEHTASYDIEKYGSRVGTMNTRLSSSSKQVVYESTTSASGLAALFVGDDLKETSVLNWHQDDKSRVLRQHSYTASRGKDSEDNQDMTFNWKPNDRVVVLGKVGNENYRNRSQDTVWGRHLIPLLMSSDLQHDANTKTSQFRVADKGRLQTYRYNLLKTESIKVNGKSIPALKFRLEREGSSRTSLIWLSKQHDYLPVRIEQFKDGETSLIMVLTAYSAA